MIRPASADRLVQDRDKLLRVLAEYEKGKLSHLSEQDAEVIRMRIANLTSQIDAGPNA